VLSPTCLGINQHLPGLSKGEGIKQREEEKLEINCSLQFFVKNKTKNVTILLLFSI
jgi:hypothetical protein